MPAASLRQARRFSAELLKLRTMPKLSFQIGQIRVTAQPDPEVKSIKLKFTGGELNTVEFSLEIDDVHVVRRSRMFVSEGAWNGRSGAASRYPNGELQFILMHGQDRQTVHEMNLLNCLDLTHGGSPGKLVLLTNTPFPGVKGGGEASDRLRRWLSAHGMRSASAGRMVLGTDADYQSLLINLITVGLLKQHMRGALVLPSLVNELPPIARDGAAMGVSVADMVALDVTAAAFEDERPGDLTGLEGKVLRHFVSRYERKPELRAAAVRIHGTVCKGCGFDFAVAYGARGRSYIEVHHLVPLSEMKGEGLVAPLTDMTVLCANCHRMVHRDPAHVLSVEELRALIAGASLAGRSCFLPISENRADP